MRAWDLQTAIKTHLEGVAALEASVYDHVEQASSMPYVVVGDDSCVEYDTDTDTGSEATVTIHVWSDYRGRKETKEIQQVIYDALHRAALTVENAHTITCEFELGESFVEPDGLTRHGVQRFRVLLTEV